MAELEVAARIHDRLGDDRGRAQAQGNLAGVPVRRDLRRAESNYRQTLDVFTRLGDEPNRLTSLGNLGVTAVRRGQVADAVLLREALAKETRPERPCERAQLAERYRSLAAINGGHGHAGLADGFAGAARRLQQGRDVRLARAPGPGRQTACRFRVELAARFRGTGVSACRRGARRGVRPSRGRPSRCRRPRRAVARGPCGMPGSGRRAAARASVLLVTTRCVGGYFANGALRARKALRRHLLEWFGEQALDVAQQFPVRR